MDLALLIFLVLLNGAFAMSEMALTAVRKARLQILVESGDAGARAAMELHDDPNRFLSLVQIGITSIGVLNGIVGDAAFSQPLGAWLMHRFALSPGIANVIATGLVVVILTFLTIIFGELVPKRLGQMYPESVARLVAQPMNWLSYAVKPFVVVLSVATQAVLRLLGIKEAPNRSVTEEEIAASLEEGLDAGVIEAHEHQMVRNVFRLDERQVSSMMIPRGEIIWLDASAPPEAALDIIARTEHSRYPVCRGGLEDVIGFVAARQLLQQLAQGRGIDLTAANLQAPVFVPETLTGMELLESFRASDMQMVFVVDEYGEIQGMITLQDVLEAITGEFRSASRPDDAWMVQREDGSWLVDGLMPVHELKDGLAIRELPEEDRGRYNTLAGMVMLLLGRLPQTADKVEWEGWCFEVVDLDGKRIDKVLATRLPPEARAED
ncbi:hemolysin family protein [Aquabacterium sp. A7-Y]|uniref:hemolysin family protein n=1 Tax=Aquabacterium sp. A7-Y TaxID=1349605 RepID=UPI00223E69F4|nr:hemolysin family protein [Aquabacterium sp. A7-Y]MCW7541974.1 hemolysin family protein [Aquabacterium sp. A7-Y]